jgi:hypothetical protein
MGLVVCGVLLFGAAACSDDGGGGDPTGALSAIFQEEEGMDKATADCMAAAIVDALGTETVSKAVAAGDDGGEQVIEDAMEEMSAEDEAAFATASLKCIPADLGELGDLEE